MNKEENQDLENFIQDWYWDEKSHKFAFSSYSLHLSPPAPNSGYYNISSQK